MGRPQTWAGRDDGPGSGELQLSPLSRTVPATRRNSASGVWPTPPNPKISAGNLLEIQI